jgi:hypothetical protein
VCGVEGGVWVEEEMCVSRGGCVWVEEDVLGVKEGLRERGGVYNILLYHPKITYSCYRMTATTQTKTHICLP